MIRAGVLTASLALAACAQSAPPAAPAALSFPTGTSAALASATLYTSPDGGIYQNPDPIQVLMVMRESGAPVIHQLGASAQSWSALTPYGDFTFVGVTIRNNGAAGSDPQLNATQIASDFAPDGTSSGTLRHFYHPMFPLALLSAQTSDASCTLHLDPGNTAVAVLVYPPVRQTSTLVWGIYQTFAVRASFGGSLPQRIDGWRTTACTPPQQTEQPAA
ncbi:MAG: hypothetical protein ABR498_02125 [Candidatus Dormibacteria bacterium]